MPNKLFKGSQRLLLDPDPHKAELEMALDQDDLYILDLKIRLSGDPIRSEGNLIYKLSALVKGINIRDANVTGLDHDLSHQIVVDKNNFLMLIRHEIYGEQADRCLIINDFAVYGTNDSEESILKRIQPPTTVDGLDKEITVTIRRGNNPSDTPARGLQTFNLMSDQKIVIMILKHFKIEDKITRVTKCTPARPLLSIGLTEPLHPDDQVLQPCLIFDPEPADTESSQLWAHLQSTREDLPRKMIIEGIYGVVNLKDVEHRLKYHGDISSNIEPLMWNEDNEDCLSGIPNGNIKLDIDLKYEINYLFFGKDIFRVSYPGQALCCSMCYSWNHRASECDRRQEGREKLRREHLQKWKKVVNYRDRTSEPAPPAPSQPDTNGSEKNIDNQIQLNITSPGDILDKYEDAYEDIHKQVQEKMDANTGEPNASDDDSSADEAETEKKESAEKLEMEG